MKEDATMQKAKPEKEIASKPKREIELLIEQLRRTKKRPEDWTFVPRRKHHAHSRVMLEDGESKLVDAGGGALRSVTTKKPVTVKVMQVTSVTPKGVLVGGYRPRQEADWPAENVLEEMIKLSLNPACEIVPYEAREMGKEAKDAQSELIAERERARVAEAKLAALEAQGVTPDAFKALQAQVDELTKPPKR